MPGELELAGVFLHQLPEAAEGHDLLERHVHSLRSGLGAKDFCGFIHESCVNPYRDFCTHTIRVLSHRENIGSGILCVGRPAKAGIACCSNSSRHLSSLSRCAGSLRSRAGLFSSAPGGAGLFKLEAPPKKSRQNAAAACVKYSLRLCCMVPEHWRLLLCAVYSSP